MTHDEKIISKLIEGEPLLAFYTKKVYHDIDANSQRCYYKGYHGTE